MDFEFLLLVPFSIFARKALGTCITGVYLACPFLPQGYPQQAVAFQRYKHRLRKPYSSCGGPCWSSEDLHVWDVWVSQLTANLPQIPTDVLLFPYLSPISNVLKPPLLPPSVPRLAWPCPLYSLRTLSLTSPPCPPLHVHLELLSKPVLFRYYLSSLGGRRGQTGMQMLIVPC